MIRTGRSKRESASFLYKIVMVGDSGVGKSNLLNRYISDNFVANRQPTIGAVFHTRILRTDGKSLTAQVWDTAGQERFHYITRQYYRGISGAVLVYDLTSKSSFENLDRWLTEVSSCVNVVNGRRDPKVILMLLGNKSDVRHLRQVSTEEGRKCAEKNAMLFMECSGESFFFPLGFFRWLIFDRFGIPQRGIRLSISSPELSLLPLSPRAASKKIHENSRKQPTPEMHKKNHGKVGDLRGTEEDMELTKGIRLDAATASGLADYSASVPAPAQLPDENKNKNRSGCAC